MLPKKHSDFESSGSGEGSGDDFMHDVISATSKVIVQLISLWFWSAYLAFLEKAALKLNDV